MNPNSILGRYLMKQLILSFLAVLLTSLGVVFIFEMIELLRRASDNNQVTFWFILQMAFSKLPQTVDMIFPFVMMIAAMITFWKVSKTSEFVIIRAAGVSIWGFLLPVLTATFLVGIVNVTVINPFSSRMYELYETLNYRFKTKDLNAVLFSDKGLWTRETTPDNKIMILQAKNVTQENNDLLLRQVSLLELDRNSKILRSMEAFAATLGDDGWLSLKDVNIYTPGLPNQKESSLKYNTALTPQRIKDTFVTPEAISFWNLPGTIKFYERSGFSVIKHHMRYLSLIASPFLLMAMILIAAVFALQANNRKGGVLYLIVSGIITGFIVYFLSQVIYAFGLNGYIPGVLAVWTPVLIAVLISVTALIQLEDG